MQSSETIRKNLRVLTRELGLLSSNSLHSGLTLTQAHVLNYLLRNGNSSFSELQSQLNIDKASLSRILTRLRKIRYVDVLNDPADKRARFVSLLPLGNKVMKQSELVANQFFEDILSFCSPESIANIETALYDLRLATLKQNIASKQKELIVEHLKEIHFENAMHLLVRIFGDEQNIPKDLIPLSTEQPQKWWCIRFDDHIYGLVALWQMESEWHWGRFSVDPSFRGLGLGKKLATESLKEAFDSGVDYVVTDSTRDAAVHILKKLGGKVTGKRQNFFGIPGTPMIVKKSDFFASLKSA